jgi:predicted membrane channel-forming protein YqfA (hemolysin III family)
LNNWRAVGYIFLGWGSVFLVYAFIVFFSIVGLFSSVPSFDGAPIALAASAQWLLLAALLYIVGIVGYYAGRDSYENPPHRKIRQYVSKIDTI